MDNYFSHGYFSKWFPKLYFIITIEAPIVSSGNVGGGSYLLPGEELFSGFVPVPDNVIPIEISVPAEKADEELPKIIKKIKNLMDDEDEEEAIILVQILSALPNHYTKKQLIFKKDDDPINIINYIAQLKN